MLDANENECVDPDWVPAIDNELIDTSGNQYEESYKHYLYLARVAANNAKALREKMADDIVTEMYGRGVEEVQIENAIDQYYETIGEICGDKKNVSKSRMVEIFKASEEKDIRELLDQEWGIDVVSVNFKNYGCNYPPALNYPKTGYVQCSEQRYCRGNDGKKLSTIIKGIENQYSALKQDWDDKISLLLTDEERNAMVASEITYEDFFENSYFDLDLPDNNAILYAGVRWDLQMMILKVYEFHKNVIDTLLASEIHDYPVIRDENIVNGRYYQKLSEIKGMEEDIGAMLDSYNALVDKTVVGIEAIIDEINQLEYHGNIEEARPIIEALTSAMSFSLSQAQYNKVNDQVWETCNSAVDRRYNEESSLAAISTGLGLLNTKLFDLKQPNGTYVNHRDSFMENCMIAVYNTLYEPFTRKADFPYEICNTLANEAWGIYSKSDSVNDYNFTPIYKFDDDEIHVAYIHREELRTAQRIWIGCQLEGSYRDSGYDLAWGWTSYWDEDTTFEKTCLEYPGEGSLWFHIDNVTSYNKVVHARLKELEKRECDRNSGCDDSQTSSTREVCTESIDSIFNDYIGDQARIAEQISELIQQAQRQSVRTTANGIEQILVDTAVGLSNTRHEIVQAIRKIASAIGDISAMEQEQIDAIERMINGKNIAAASSYANLNEWNDRLNYNKEQYKKQLKRAKKAAWIARRAIEFRLGVDLSNEETRTIHGDIPKVWADELFVMDSSKCGDETSSEENGEETRKLGDCIKPEERIEDYVQKLEDYVESYGNSPDQEWWFHEDDDIGVISLRDNIAISNVPVETHLSNMLFFSEEFDMTLAEFEEKYNSILDNFVPSFEDKEYGWEMIMPSLWTGNAEIIEEEEMAAKTGMPSPGLIRKENQKESKLYSDGNEEITTEILKLESDGAAPGNQRIEQTVSLKDLQYQTNIDSPLVFSTYLKNAPKETICSVDERYFEKLGKCAKSCDPEEAEPCENEGQICHFAGYDESEVLEESGELYACVWCTADKSCIEQNGTVVQLELDATNSTKRTQARRNVFVKNSWENKEVYTINGDEYQTQDVTEIGDAIVSITNANTKNLIGSSEKYSNGQGWESTAEILEQYTTGVAPDRTQKYQQIQFYQGSSSAGELSIWADKPATPTKNYSASLWIKNDTANDEEKVELKISLVDRVLGQLDTSRIKREDVGNEWTRVEVTGSPREDAEEIGVVITTEDDVEQGDWSGKIGVWGIQIEEGSESTVYLPTGKNQVPSRNMLADWGQSIGREIVVSQNAEIKNPIGELGQNSNVYTLEDTDVDYNSYIEYVKTGIAAGNSAIFSIWVKSDEYDDRCRLYVESPTAVGLGELYPETNEDWKRYQVPIEAVSGQSLTDVTIRIYPTYAGAGGIGRIHIWGPQLEMSDVATGYQETDTNVDDYTKRWDSTIGVTAAQLTSARITMCPGQTGTSSSTRICPKGPKDYVRNTYNRTHYSDDYDIVLSDDNIAFPSPDQFVARISREKSTEIFKDQFELVESGNEQPDYYKFDPFNLYVENIEAGLMGKFGIVAANNFNYRLTNVAVNIVGTDVIDCDYAISPANCAANNWITYDLKQMGDVRIRNHTMVDTVKVYNIPTGRISGGKAWAAEQVVGYPISGSHWNMLSQINRKSLMGRPMEGLFELRIHNTPEVNWNNVEDVQIIMGYHYWTRSE